MGKSRSPASRIQAALSAEQPQEECPEELLSSLAAHLAAVVVSGVELCAGAVLPQNNPTVQNGLEAQRRIIEQLVALESAPERAEPREEDDGLEADIAEIRDIRERIPGSLSSEVLRT